MRHTSRGSSSFADKSILVNKIQRKDIPKDKTQAILVTRQTGGIGDMLMITPTIRAIKESNPNIPLVLCTTDRYGGGRGVLFDILKHNPYIDKAITSNELMNYQFNKVYNFGTGAENTIEQHGNHPTGNRIDIFAELADIKLKNKRPVYVVTETEKEQVFKWIEKNIDPSRRRLIGIQMRAASPRRDWDQEKMLLLAFKIVNTWEDSSVLVFYEGLFEDYYRKYPNIHNLVGLPIRHVAALINQCSLLITPDSGLMHLGGALKKKMVCIFGSILPSARIEYYPEAVGVRSHICDKQPCWYATCEEKFKCLSEITVDDVMNKVSEQLGFKPDRNLSGKILVVRMGGIGDLVMMTPSFRAIKNKYPGGEITLATRPDHLDVLANLPYIDKIISLEERHQGEYDAILDTRMKVESPELGGSLSTEMYKSINRIEMFSKIMGVYPLDDTQVDIHVDQEEVKKIKKVIKYSKRFKWIGVQATCTSNLRTFPPEYVVELSKKLSKMKGTKVVLFGRSESWHGRRSNISLKAIEGKNIINLMDKFPSVKEMVALISIMDKLIAPDSSAVHIAGALKIPCLAVFGNIPPKLRTLFYKTVSNLYPEDELECVPCYDFKNPCEHYKHLKTDEQPIGGKCMYLLTPDRIIKEVLKI